MSVADNAKQMRSRCLDMMREEIARSCNPLLDAQERMDSVELARIYSQLADNHLQTMLAAETIRPGRFTGRNAGPQGKTALRCEYLRQIIGEIGTAKAAAVAAEAAGRTEGRKLWPGGDVAAKIERFIKRHKIGADF